MNQTQKYLIDNGIKPSFQRLAIMDYLINNRTHPTVDEIYESLNPQIPTLSKTTIYNTLKLFVDNKVALSVNIDDKQLRFDGDVTPHIHFQCRECGCIIDIPYHINQILPDSNLLIEETYINMKGLCENCKG